MIEVKTGTPQELGGCMACERPFDFELGYTAERVIQYSLVTSNTAWTSRLCDRCVDELIDKLRQAQGCRHVGEVSELRRALTDEIAQLQDWARMSRTGGWSTHLNEPMLRRADDLRRVLIP